MRHCELVWVLSLLHLHEACESGLMHEVPWFHCELVWVPSLSTCMRLVSCPWFHCELVWVPLHEACVLHLMHEVPWFHCELVWVPSLLHLHEACESAPDA